MSDGINNAFMLDIETTGLDIVRDQVLEIGIVHVVKKDRFWMPKEELCLTIYSDQVPQTDFARKYQEKLYKKANRSKLKKPGTIREKILEFFKKNSKKDQLPVIMGKNAGGFDIPFLVQNGYLVKEKKYYGKKKDVLYTKSDISHRVYDISSLIYYIQDMNKGISRKEVIELAIRRYPLPKKIEKMEHNAIYDCYEQLSILNGLLRWSDVGPLSENKK